MAASSRSLLAALLAGIAATPLAAQQPVVVSGRIVRLATPGDTVGVPTARVVLHRVSTESQGALDSVRTRSGGEFRFTTPRDTTGLYLVSARHGGIEFFSDPVRLPAQGNPDLVSLLVSDTSSSQPIALAGRYVVIGAPDAERRRTVVDLFVLNNPGVVARVAADTMTPTWSGLLPAGAAHRIPEVGSEISALAVRFAGDTVLVFAPLTPGQRQLLVEHTIPASQRELVLPLGPETVPVQIVTEEPGATIRGGDLTRAESQVVDGRPLERWTGTPPGGTRVQVAFPGPPASEGTVALGLAALVAAVLVAGTLVALRRRRLAAPEPRR